LPSIFAFDLALKGRSLKRAVKTKKSMPALANPFPCFDNQPGKFLHYLG